MAAAAAAPTEALSIMCNACRTLIPPVNRMAHYRDAWHVYNVRRRVTSLPPVSLDAFQQLLQAHAKASSQRPTRTVCNICRGKQFKSKKALEHHTKTRGHLRNVEKEQQRAIDQEAEEEEEEEDDGFGNLKDEFDEDQEPQEPDPLDPDEGCFFCTRTDFDNLATLLQHMRQDHGFFIPYQENMSDLGGFLSYVGAKLGSGLTCLYCNGARWKDLQSLRNHMEAKNHCHIVLETEEDDEEYAPFYDFSNKTVDASRPRLVGMNDASELVMSDGSTRGHREHRRIYDKKIRPVRESDVIAAQSRARLAYGDETQQQMVQGARSTSYALSHRRRLPPQTVSRFHKISSSGAGAKARIVVTRAAKQRMKLGIKHNKLFKMHTSVADC